MGMNSPVRQRQWIFPVVNLLILAALLYMGTLGLGNAAPERVSYTEFLAQMRAGKLSAVEITDQDLIGVKKPDTEKKKGQPSAGERIIATRLPGIDDTSLLKELEDHQIKVTGVVENNAWIWGLMGWVIPLLLIGALYAFGMRRLRQGGGAMTFGRNRAKIHDQSTSVKVTFADVAGVDEAKTELLEIVDFLRRPARYQALEGAFPKGSCS